jgi:hypothetical protein
MEKLINDFKICFTKGDTYALAVKFKDITKDLSKAQFTVKENPDDVPLIQKTLNAGISKIDDRAYKSEKTYKVQIQASDTVFLEAGVQYLYDLQVTIGNVVKTVLSGVFVVNHSVSGVSSATTSALEVSAIDEVETEFATTPATVGLEYESDPVALAKIGNLASLETDVKSTVVGAINEMQGRLVETYDNVDSILHGDTEVGIARRAANATNAEFASRTNAINWFAPTDETVEGGNIALRAKATMTLASRLTDNSFPTGYYAYKISVMSVTLTEGQTVYVPYSSTVLVKGEIRKHPYNTTDASLYFVYHTANYPYALTLNKTYNIGRGISVERAEQASTAVKANTAYSATKATDADYVALKKIDAVVYDEGATYERYAPINALGLYLAVVEELENGARKSLHTGFIYIGEEDTDARGSILQIKGETNNAYEYNYTTRVIYEYISGYGKYGITIDGAKAVSITNKQTGFALVAVYRLAR